MQSPFDVLGVDRDADDEDVERAFRRRVKEAHPDQGGSVEEFRSVMVAYDRITSGRVDEERTEREVDDGPRNAYDRRHGSGRSGGRPHGDDERSDRRSERARVEYLNFECLDDHGWGLDDEDLFEKAADAGLEGADYGRILVESDESLLEAAENRGFSWPYACRGGACANCAVAVCDGSVSQPVDHILPESMTDRGIRLSCVGAPTDGELQVVYNVKHLPDLDELRLPPRPFDQAQAD